MRLMLIQIQRWLKQPKLWSFVCFASSVIGLLCYALSSSSTNLFGKWNWWKIFLYIVVSSIICLLNLSAKRWQSTTTSPWLKVNLTFLVLFITSAYSSFLDRKAKRKPDAYNIISWAAFAVMSLCLPRQTLYGFEIDLLPFFSGGLMIQLTMINLWLLNVGACFSNALIILRHKLELNAPSRSENLPCFSSDVPGNEVVIPILSDSQEINTGTGNANLIIMPQEADNTTDSTLEENSCAPEGKRGVVPAQETTGDRLPVEGEDITGYAEESKDPWTVGSRLPKTTFTGYLGRSS